MTTRASVSITILTTGEATTGRLAAIETWEQRGNEPPCHRHHWEDELLYVLEGELAVYVERAWHAVPSGGVVVVPRGAEYTFAVVGEAARLLTVVTPAGFEGFYRELADAALANTWGTAPLDWWIATAARYGCEITAPHPGARAGHSD